MIIRRINKYDAHRKVIACIRSCNKIKQLRSMQEWALKTARSIDSQDDSSVMFLFNGRVQYTGLLRSEIMKSLELKLEELKAVESGNV